MRDERFFRKTTINAKTAFYKNILFLAAAIGQCCGFIFFYCWVEQTNPILYNFEGI